MTGEAAQLAALLDRLAKTEWLSPDEIAQGQRHQFAALSAHHARHSGQFARRLANAGLAPEEAATPGGFERLGLLTRHELQTAPDLFADAVPEDHGRIFTTHSSGSTGRPVMCRRTALNQLDWLAITMRDHGWHRRDLSGRLCAIRPYVPEVRLAADWGPPANLLHKTGPSLAIPIRTPFARQIELLGKFRPHSLIVFPSGLAALLRHIEREGASMEELREIRTVSEALPDGLREEVRRVLGVPIRDVYSGEEAGYIALQCPVSGLYHTMAEMLIIEILDAEGRPCAPGETGHVIITDLRNFATPLIRYDIGDMAEAGEPCPCGRGLPTLRRIRGRVRNLVTYPDGHRAWPVIGMENFRRHAPIAQYQIVQIDRETIEVRLVLDAPMTAAQETALADNILTSLGHRFTLRFAVQEGPLALGGTGKYEEFLSLLSD